MSLQSIMQRVGGFRGLAAGAAIAWGTAQATTIAEQAQAQAQAAGEALQDLTVALAEKTAELESLAERRSEFIADMRKEARLDVAGSITAGKWDNAVMARARALAAPEPAPVDIEDGLFDVATGTDALTAE